MAKLAQHSRGVFISYRRDETAAEAGRLRDNLRTREPGWRVFFDVDSIRAGSDFVAEIDRQLEASGALLAVIGPGWAGMTDGQGRRRLDDPEDVVRLELEHALALGIPILPLVVRDARMPRASELPPSLRRVARLNAIELRHVTFERDLDDVLAATQRLVAPDAGNAAESVKTSVELVEKADRRTRTVRIVLPGRDYLVEYTKLHSPPFRRVKLDGLVLQSTRERSLGGILRMVAETTFELADGRGRDHPVAIRVRYLTDLQWIIAMLVTVDGSERYREGGSL